MAYASPRRRSIDRARATVDLTIRIGALAACLYWFVVLIAPFAIFALWATIIAVSLHPLHRWFSAQLGGRPRLAATLISLLGLAVVLGPAAALSFSLTATVQDLVGGLRTGTLVLPEPPQGIKDWPVVGSTIHDLWSSAADNLQAVVGAYRPALVRMGSSVLAKLATLAADVLTIAVSMIVAGVLLVQADVLSTGARRIARRFLARRGEAFVDLAGDTIRSVSQGVVGVATLQAVLAGGALLLIGIPGAGMITLGVLILSLVQIGPGLVLIPVLAWAWTQLGWLTALMFTAYIVPVALVDNVLKPILIKRGLRTPMLVLLVGLIGGLLAHGVVGLFVGPIVLAVFYELVAAWVSDPASSAPELAEGCKTPQD